MDVFKEVNEMSASGISEFRIHLDFESRLVIFGSFDLDYYHDIEITFTGVQSIDCPVEIRWPQFYDPGPPGELRQFVIVDRWDDTHEIVARDVSVEIGKVYHFDHGQVLKPGERLAPWVKRRKTFWQEVGGFFGGLVRGKRASPSDASSAEKQ